MRFVIVVSLLFLFNGPADADYVCRVSLRQMIASAPFPGCDVPCFVMGPPTPIACIVWPSDFQDADYEVYAGNGIPLGAVLMGCVYAAQGAAHSVCIGWSD